MSLRISLYAKKILKNNISSQEHSCGTFSLL